MLRCSRSLAPLCVLTLAVALTPARARADEIPIDSDTFGGLTARSIGPAAMSGRIAAIDAVAGDKLTVYVGAAGGGVWRSVDGGTTFSSVFDKHAQSIGAIAVDPSHPQTVWVGTGESWTRNSVSVGDGIYKSTDAGDTWERMGLAESERIARIAVDPTHGDVVYVAVPGHLWNDHTERGVYKTVDGGKTWQRVLYVNERTGCSDVALDPSNPRTLYAGMWQFRRTPYSFASGGPGSGVYKSIDGGATWTRLANGLPSGDMGRIAVAVAPSRPNIVYALVESKKTALYRSENRGETWTRVNGGGIVAQRPFYFARLAVDPTDDKRVYKTAQVLGASEDGGRTFTAIGGSVHSDHHALWINPKNPQHMFLGTDGGVYVSEDRGNRWRFLPNLPVSQFYHVSTDDAWPYNVYGGLQDNGSWTAPSRRTGGIGNRHWQVLGGGDGFWAFADPADSDLAYVEYQGGNLLRVRRSTGETKDIRPYPPAGGAELRFNWNTPVQCTSSRGGTLYIGSQFLYRSRDRGDSWERISPDLTTNDPAKQKQLESGGLTIDNSTAENFCTIYAISESPVNADVIWVGTDDGNVQITRDGGKKWSAVSRRIQGLPRGTWVSFLCASPQAEGTAYATFDGHMTGDMTTYVYKTTDYGATWRALGTSDLHGYAHVIRDDPVNPSLLYLGTEAGLFVSLDGGARWAQFTSGLPNVAVRDLAIQRREGDLVMATHGRGVYILDDLTPLRALTPRVLQADAALLPSRPAVMTIPAGEQRFDGDAEFSGDSPDDIAEIAYYLKKRRLFGDVTLSVYDAGGHLVTTLPASKRRGVNRAEWPMRLKPPQVPPASSLVPQPYSILGPRVPEGTYTVKLTAGGDSFTTQLQLVVDPRSRHSAEDRAVQQAAALRLYHMLERLTFVVDAISGLRDQLAARSEKLPRGDATAKKLSALSGDLEVLRKSLVSTREGGMLSGERELREKLGSLYGAINGYDGRPARSQLEYADVLEKDLNDAAARYDALSTRDVPALNAQLAKRRVEPLAPLTFDAWRAAHEKS
jgi:photosystem II stability/assembly factor-like uncharacterized protein